MQEKNIMKEKISNFLLLLLLLKIAYSFITGCAATSQVNRPYNLPWKRNWCWMVSTLHCLHRIDDFRKIVFQISAQDASKQETKAHKLGLFLQQIFLLMQKKSQYDINDPSIFYESLFSGDLHAHLKSLPAIQKLKNHHDDFYTNYTEADTRPEKRKDPGKYEGDVFNKAQSKAIKYAYFDDAITALDFNKIGEPNDSSGLIWLIISAFKGIPEIGPLLKKRLVYLHNSDTKAIKSSRRVNIISFFPGTPTSKEACPQIIETDAGTFELLAIVMQKIDSHATALVKYDNQWFLYDSMQWENHSYGECLGYDLEIILDKTAQSGYYPYIIFYQKEKNQLTLKLSELRKKLESLKEKLKALQQSLELLKISISQNQ